MADPVRDFLGDANGHLAIVNGDFAVVAGRAAVVQGVGVRAKFFLADSYLDESQGIDYLGQIFNVKNPDQIVTSELIREGIADTPDLLTVVASSFTDSSADREASVAFQIRDVYSEQPVQGQVDVTLP